MPEPQAHTCAQHQDRILLRTQCECLAYRILSAIPQLDGLYVTSESNQTFANVRDSLADLLNEIEALTPIKETEYVGIKSARR